MFDLAFRKSSYSHANQCVEIAARGGSVILRDSKNPQGVRLSFDRRVFLAVRREIATRQPACSGTDLS